MVNWIACFSHTGREVVNISRQMKMDGLPVNLKAAFTDNVNFNNDVVPYVNASRKVISMLLENLQMKDCIVTLNGYLGILSERTLNTLKKRGCKVYNIHPAPIWIYPELKGLDPQERLYEGIKTGQYTYIGIAIHEVTPELDSGRLVHWRMEMADPNWSKDDLYSRLHSMGTDMWLDFFREEMWKDGQTS